MLITTPHLSEIKGQSMRLLSLLLLCISLNSFATDQQDADRIKKMREVATKATTLIMEEFANIFNISYSEFVMDKYLVGAELYYKVGITVNYLRCSPNEEEPTLPPTCIEILRENLSFKDEPIATQMQKDLSTIISSHFKYNLKKPANINIYSHTGAFLKIGLPKEEMSDGESVFDRKESKKWSKISEDGQYRVTVDLFVHFFATPSVIRFMKETIETDKITIQPSNERIIHDAEISYDRLGPGLNQTDISESAKIDNNKNTSPLENVVTGDYEVKLKNAFCGCEFTLSNDQVLDTRSSDAQKAHSFQLNGLIETTVKGIAVSSDNQSRPLENKELHLKAKCDKTDECMKKDFVTISDEKGHFEFKDVPKGVYHLTYEGKKIAIVKNCTQNVAIEDIGEVKIKLIMLYDLFLDFNSPGYQVKLVWPNNSLTMIRDDFSNVNNYNLVSEDQYNIDDFVIPYKISGPLVPPQADEAKRIYWGVSKRLDMRPELISCKVKGMPYCALEQDEDSAHLLDFFYQEIPTASADGNLQKGYYIQLQAVLNVGASADESTQFPWITLDALNSSSGLDHFLTKTPLDQSFIDAISKGETQTLNYANQFGGSLKLEFKFKDEKVFENQNLD